MGDYTTGDLMAAEDDIVIDVLDGKPIPTNAVDRLPPWRARMIVRLALRAGGVLQDGTPEQFDQAAVAAGKTDAGRLGWWREALGLPPRPELTPAPLYVPPAGLPAGWSYAPSGEGGTRTREGQ
jgi:hypothetical protein